MGESKKFGFEQDGPARRFNIGKLSICAGGFDVEQMLRALLDDTHEVIKEVIVDNPEIEILRNQVKAFELETENIHKVYKEALEATESDKLILRKNINELKSAAEAATEELTDKIEDLEYELNDSVELTDNYSEDVKRLDLQLKELKEDHKELTEYVIELENDHDDLDYNYIDMINECLERKQLKRGCVAPDS